jgi:hypothetical protein
LFSQVEKDTNYGYIQHQWKNKNILEFTGRSGSADTENTHLSRANLFSLIQVIQAHKNRVWGAKASKITSGLGGKRNQTTTKEKRTTIHIVFTDNATVSECPYKNGLEIKQTGSKLHWVEDQNFAAPQRLCERQQGWRPRMPETQIPQFLAAGILLLALHNVLRSLVEPPAPAFRNHSCLHDSSFKPPHHGISWLILSDENLRTTKERSSPLTKSKS